MPTPIPLVENLPLVTDSVDDFSTKATGVWPQVNASFTVMNEVAEEVTTAAALAVLAEQSIVAAAHYVGPWSGLTGALAIPATVTHLDQLWILEADLADVTAHEPGVSAAWLQPVQYAKDVVFDVAPAVLYQGNVGSAVAELLASTSNLIRNRNMVEVNRSRAWSYPQAISAGSFVFDAWKAGAGGATISAQGGGVTIATGTMVETVFTASALVYGGLQPVADTPITIAWTGTAQARVNGGAYSASPLVFTPATMPLSFELEFNAGTVSKVRAHIGVIAPPFVAQRDVEAQAEADFDYQEVAVNHNWTAGGASDVLGLSHALPSRMRSTTVASWAASPVANLNISGTPTVTLFNGQRAINVGTTAAAAGLAQYFNTVILASGD